MSKYDQLDYLTFSEKNNGTIPKCAKYKERVLTNKVKSINNVNRDTNKRKEGDLYYIREINCCFCDISNANNYYSFCSTNINGTILTHDLMKKM